MDRVRTSNLIWPRARLVPINQCICTVLCCVQLYPTSMSIGDYPFQFLPSQRSSSSRLFDVHLWQSLLRHRRRRSVANDVAVVIIITVVQTGQLVVSAVVVLSSPSCFSTPTTEEGEGVAFAVGIMQRRACIGSPRSGRSKTGKGSK